LDAAAKRLEFSCGGMSLEVTRIASADQESG